MGWFDVVCWCRSQSTNNKIKSSIHNLPVSPVIWVNCELFQLWYCSYLWTVRTLVLWLIAQDITCTSVIIWVRPAGCCQAEKQVGEVSSWTVSPLPTRTSFCLPPGHNTTSSDPSSGPPLRSLWTDFSMLNMETLESGSGPSEAGIYELPSMIQVKWAYWILLRSSPCSTKNVYLLPCSSLWGIVVVRRSNFMVCPLLVKVMLSCPAIVVPGPAPSCSLSRKWYKQRFSTGPVVR